MPKENPTTTRVLGSLSQRIQQVSVALPDQLVPIDSRQRAFTTGSLCGH
jgi:hypothetical protein